MIKLRSILLASIIILLGVTTTLKAEFKTFSAEGIAGDIDKKRRSPVVGARNINESGGVKIVVDAYIPNEDYQKYPIQLDFYIDRRLFSSQIRSPEISGPLGIDVGPDIASLPFNYVIVARTLHPNREFTTVLSAPTLEFGVTESFNCSLVQAKANANPTLEVTANSVTPEQSDAQHVSIILKTNDASGKKNVSLVATLNVNNSTSSASGTLSLNVDGESQVIQVSGDANIEGDVLKSFELESSDKSTIFNCS